MPPRLSIGAPAAPGASKILKKDRIVQALTRMNDRDTQKAAAEDLLSIVSTLDQEGLIIILSCLCTTGSEHKVFARKECARAIGVIASGTCPLREQALQQPHLGKMLGQLRKSLQDPDSGVREASSEALALVAQGLAHLEASGGPQGTLNNPVLKLIFDCLAEQRKELNAAACTALGQAAPFLGTLDVALSRDLVRKLNSSSFQAPAALLAALARSDPATGEPVGLMKSGPAAFIPHLSALVGQPAPPSVGSSGGALGSGVAGALSRPDWPVRFAAADMLRSTALLLGPLMELDGCWAKGDARSITSRAIRALESCKFDKVRDVRDVARNALAVLEDLHEYGSGGGSTAGWPAHIALKLYGPDVPVPVAATTFTLPSVADAAVGGRKSPVRRSAVSPGRRPRSAQPQPRASNSPPPLGRTPTPPERRSSPNLARGGSVSERFRAAHRDNDVVSVHYLGGVESAPLPEAAGEEARRGVAQLCESASTNLAPSAASKPGVQDDTAPDAPHGGRTAPRQPSKASYGAWAAERFPTLASMLDGGVDLGTTHELIRNLMLEGDTAAVLDTDSPPTFSQPFNKEPPSAAELAEWAAAATAADLLPPPVFPAPPSAAAAVTAAASHGVLASPSPVAAAAVSVPSVSVPVDEWRAAQQRLRSLEEQQRQLLEAFHSMATQNRRTIAGLQAKVSSLEAALETAQSQVAAQEQQQGEEREPLTAAEVPWASRTIRPGPPLVPPTSTAGSTADPTPITATSGPPTAALMATDRAAASPQPGEGPDPAAFSEARQAYREVLASGRLNEMQLLRLMFRTGPIWGELGPELSGQLLAAFTASLQQARADGPMLARMMPWLWRLADEANIVYEPPAEMRAPLVAALRSAQTSVTDPALYEKMVLLVSTLRTIWSLPDAPAAAGQPGRQPSPCQMLPQQQQPSPPFPQSGPVQQELSFGLGAMLGQLSEAAAAAAAAVPSRVAAAVTGMSGGYTTFSPDGNGVSMTCVESQSPRTDGLGPPTVTPRVAAVRSSQAAGRSPSIGTLMGQWSDLQRDFAAMSSPSNRPQSRGQAQ